MLRTSENALKAIRSVIRDVVDDWCGVCPSKWPWPARFDAVQLRPIDLLVAGAQFHKAASLDNPLQADFSAAADQLFATGLERIEGSYSKQSASAEKTGDLLVVNAARYCDGAWEKRWKQEGGESRKLRLLRIRVCAGNQR